MDLGGSRLKVFMRVTLPLAVPGIASSMLILFIETLADFGNPLVLAGSRFPVLSVQAYLQITGMYDLPKGSALSILLLVPSLTAYLVQKRWVERKRYVTVTGKPQASSTSIASAGARRLVFALCLLVAAFVVLIYAAIIWGAFAKVWGFNPSPTLDHFRYVFSVGFKAVRDTLLIAGLSAPAAGLLGMVIAFLVMRKRFPGRRFMEAASMLSFAVPGTVIGIGYIMAFNQSPFLLTGTATILVISFIFRNMPVGIRSGIAALTQIDVALEEASVTLRASFATTVRRIVLPLVKPAIVSALVFSFVRAVTAISAVVFLVSAKWQLSTKVILDQAENGRYGLATAYSTVLIVIMAAAIAAMYLLVGKTATRDTLQGGGLS
jgi:iron(III) transport system permease protein